MFHFVEYVCTLGGLGTPIFVILSLTFSEDLLCPQDIVSISYFASFNLCNQPALEFFHCTA